MGLDIDSVSKTYGSLKAVDNVSFSVAPGKIFGFLGTNGSGKTTTMRMILDIIRPDQGAIAWNGQPIASVARNEFGYLPEERGLYPKMGVEEQLLFVAQLYGAEKAAARASLDEWLERLDIEENRHKTVEQLSKGNQQKIQFLAAILHDPDILIFDEPFSGLDPVNADQMKQAFLEMRSRGKTIIFSTHQLNDAQELCHEVVIINRGKVLISGEVTDVRKSMDRQVVRFATASGAKQPWLERIPDVSVVRTREDHVELRVPNATAAQRVLTEAVGRNEVVTQFDISYPSINDIFLDLVRGSVDDGADVTDLVASA